MELVLSNMSTQKRRSKPNSQRQHPDDKPSRTTEAQCCLVKHPTKQKAAPIHTNNYTQQLQHLSPLRCCSEGSDLLPPVAVRQFHPSASGVPQADKGWALHLRNCSLGAAPMVKQHGAQLHRAATALLRAALPLPDCRELLPGVKNIRLGAGKSLFFFFFLEIVPLCLSQYMHLRGL